ncbi:MAG: hypothetical protein H7A51_13355 [Akkermansiaceae bacterium]|nr:hypothetical protein [Akkermansiaceae bacterium]
MEQQSYNTFKDASAAAKHMAMINRITTKIVRNGDLWVVSSLSPESLTQSACQSPTRFRRTGPISPDPPTHNHDYEYFDHYDDAPTEDEEEDDSDDEELDEMDMRDRINDYWDEIGSYRENFARSSNDGWFHPEREGSSEDNYYREE